MKAILISDHAKWCALMMNGDKTVEVRKGTALYKATQKLIDEYGFADFYVYCILGSPYLAKPKESEKYLLFTKGAIKLIEEQPLNGKVIFKFRCYKVEEIVFFEEFVYPNGYEDYDGEWVDTSETYKNVHYINSGTRQKTCLSYEELQNYLGKKTGCAIHISNLEIFDKPKELSEFKHYLELWKRPCDFKTCSHYWEDYSGTPIEPKCGLGWKCDKNKPLTKAPQSWCYVESDELE